MPLVNINVTNLAPDDQRIEELLLHETGRIFILDREWSSLPTSADGYHIFLYDSDVEFILIKTDREGEFRRILPVATDGLSACISWANGSGEHYYIFKVDPAQKLIVAGNATVRFFYRPKEDATAPAPYKRRSRTTERPPRHWEAEDVDERRDVITGESYRPEYLVEMARRFKAWRAMTTDQLFVYLLVPKSLQEGEWTQLLDDGFQFFDDVPWIL